MSRNGDSHGERILVSLVEHFGSGAGLQHVSETEIALHRIEHVLPCGEERLAFSCKPQKAAVRINVGRLPLGA